MKDFNKCIDMCGILELNSSSGLMSWTNGQVWRARKQAKLDCVLVNVSFMNCF